MRLNYFAGYVKMNVKGAQGFGSGAEIADERTAASDGDAAIARRVKLRAAKFWWFGG